ncbi:MAG: glycosyltransferase [Acidobacteriia bacterium]|nr:glycosyltransferase [Terriglobia bacterium]
MRVVYVSLSYLPTVAGGVQVLTHSIAKEMQARGHEVEVICAESIESGDDDRIRTERTIYDDIPVVRLSFNRYHMPRYFRTFYDIPQVGEHLFKLYEAQKPDLFHITHFSRLTASIFQGIRRLGVPSILTLADYTFFCPLGTLLRYNGDICAGARAVGGVKCLGCFVDETRTYKNSVFRRFLNADQVAAGLKVLGKTPLVRSVLPSIYSDAAEIFEDRVKFFDSVLPCIDLFTTNNHWSRQFYIDQGFPPERTRCVVQTLDVSWSHDFVRTPYSGPFRIGFTGAVVSHKGVDVLVKAYQRMKHRDRAEVFIYGDNVSHPLYLQELEALCGGNKRIHMKGSYWPTDLKRIYNEMDVLVVPSMFYETGPLVILEAQATRTPVLASNLGPIRELVRHGIDGYLFERGDDRELAALLDRICEDPDELGRLRANIRPVKTIGAMADELEALYHESTRARAA